MKEDLKKNIETSAYEVRAAREAVDSAKAAVESQKSLIASQHDVLRSLESGLRSLFQSQDHASKRVIQAESRYHFYTNEALVHPF